MSMHLADDLLPIPFCPVFVCANLQVKDVLIGTVQDELMSSPPAVSVERLSPRSLIVDKEPIVRSTARSVLSKLGFSVTDTSDGRYALSLIQTNKPCFDLLVTESEPHGVDGKTLAESFMLACRLGRVVIMSAADDVDSVNVESTGAWVFVSKRRLSETLVEAVRRIGLSHAQHVVLLVDDDQQVRTFVRTILMQAGHAVICAGDGQEALELSRTYREAIDLVLSDITMPRMTGPELAEHIRQERPDTQVLLMSGYVSGAILDYARSHDFIQKPFAPKKIIDQVSELLNHPKTAAAS
jgi:DNA-binding NtrC family response regulator